ncbi:unnamed protein product [Paramecium primaurelia]|uniref:Tetratricopeptide repeat protein n=1 Tax=Paramecium primaurelia TaxID=5886 RepID=A0A8S1QUM3_PARPR|nr:unnamed protein product [Paramecium primaurelia]
MAQFIVQEVIRLQVIIASLHLSLGNKDKFIIDHDKAINYYNRGNQDQSMKKFDRALKDQNKAIEFNSNDVKAQNNKGNLYQQNNIKQLGFQDCIQALNQNQTNPFNGELS